MIRFFEYCKNRAVKWAKNNTTLDWISVGLWIIVAITIAVLMFFVIDTTPATLEDYEPLVKRAQYVQDNPITILEENGEIHVYDGKIVLEIENNQCKIKATYDTNLELQEIEKRDKAHSIVFAVIASGITGYLGGFLIVNILAFIWFMGSGIRDLISKAVNKMKRKEKSE